MTADKPKGGLGRFVRAGKAHGEALKRRDALVSGVSSTVHEDARERLEEAKKHAARGGLVDREWVLVTVRGLIGLVDADDPRGAEILAEADVLKQKVLEQDEQEFAALRADMKNGVYTAEQWRADMARRPEFEQDAFTHRLLGLHDPPRPSYAREDEMVHFVASTVKDVLEVAELVGSDDVFYDIGCGTGKVAMLIRWLTNATVKGVEFDSAYVVAANAAKDDVGIDVRFIESDARTVDYDDATVLYLYEPFRGEIMSSFLDRLKALDNTFMLLSRFVVVDGLEGVPWLELVEDRPETRVRRYRRRQDGTSS